MWNAMLGVMLGMWMVGEGVWDNINIVAGVIIVITGTVSAQRSRSTVAGA